MLKIASPPDHERCAEPASPADARRGRWCRAGVRTAATCLVSAVGWTAIGTLDLSPLGAWLTGLVTTVAVIAMVAVAVFLTKDNRSPFERLMLLACLVLQRSPGTYIPPASSAFTSTTFTSTATPDDDAPCPGETSPDSDFPSPLRKGTVRDWR